MTKESASIGLGLLSGVRILDLSNVLAGPMAGHQLAYLGADVIKLEYKDRGDLARELGAGKDLIQQKMGISFLAQNSGKRSLELNLKKAEGKKIFKELVRQSDVLLENFRPKVMERLGLGFQNLLDCNSSLIYCALTGFGQDGPMSQAPAYDQIIQGESGLMSFTGDEQSAPLRVGYPIADTLGGLTAAMVIAAALVQSKKRKKLKEALYIDVSMLESLLASMGWVVSNYLLAGQKPKPIGNENFTASPSGSFQTKKGLINISANKQEQFESLAAMLGRQDWLSDDRFATRLKRLRYRKQLQELLEKELRRKSAQAWKQLCLRHNIPAGLVLRLDEVLHGQQLQARSCFAEFPYPASKEESRKKNFKKKKYKLLPIGFQLNGKSPRVKTPPPYLGEHSEAILKERLGYSKKKIQALKRENII